MARKSENSLIQLEWFNVTYRAVFRNVALLIILLLAGGAYWYYTIRYAPKAAAESALAQAESKYSEASKLEPLEGLSELLGRAGSVLEEALEAFGAKAYDDAEFAALHSLDLSLKAISMSSGQDSDGLVVRFYRIEGDVRVKKRGEFSWREANPRTVMTRGDQIKTSSSASAQLIYFDGTVTTVGPGSLLEIHRLFEDPVTKVSHVEAKLDFGEVKASTPERKVRGSYHQVETEKVAARADKSSEFSISYDQGSKVSQVNAYRGPLDVTSSGNRISMRGGEQVLADEHGRLSNKRALPGVARLQYPADQRIFIFEDPLKQKISLQWEEVANTAQYLLMISDRALFTEPLYEQKREGTSATLDGVAPGSYFWKVAAISPTGVQGPFSEARGFRVSSQKIKDLDDTVPPGLDITEFVNVGLLVIVNGQSEPGATLWVDDERVEVHDDGRFYAVVRLRKEGLNDVIFRAQDTAGNETKLSRSTYVEIY